MVVLHNNLVRVTYLTTYYITIVITITTVIMSNNNNYYYSYFYDDDELMIIIDVVNIFWFCSILYAYCIFIRQYSLQNVAFLYNMLVVVILGNKFTHFGQDWSNC